jgi:hypothetical protein
MVLSQRILGVFLPNGVYTNTLPFANMEVRDNFRSVLAPGRGNRVTTASVYVFAEEIRNIFNYVWPSEVFDAMGIDDDEDELLLGAAAESARSEGMLGAVKWAEIQPTKEGWYV